MTSMERLLAANAAKRLRERDPSLFTDDPATAELVIARLGWTELADAADELTPELIALTHELAGEGVTDVALLGMGGSSLASLVFWNVFGPHGEGMRLHVLDTTSPVTIRSKLEELDPARTAFLVSSKSGTTIEPLSLLSIFREWSDTALGRDRAGRRFVVITDPGSALEARAHADGLRTVLSSPADVGGRYSALTVFGLAPAALIGVELAELVGRARAAEAACASPAPDNPAVRLAAFIGDAQSAGRDKLTIVASPALSSFGLWVEQLVAESTGKHGTGIVPVVELADEPAGYGDDRAVVIVRLAEDTVLASTAETLAATAPTFECVLTDRYDLGAEFVRWEHAIALVGHLLGINPFDEPDVSAAKRATSDVLEGRVAAASLHELDGGVAVSAANLTLPETASTLSAALCAAAGSLGERDYLAILAFLPDDDALLAPLRTAAAAISSAMGRAVCLELGPRYLHSTGQLHKGGPDEGVFVLVSARDATDVEIPGAPYTLGQLHRAQAEGDHATLAARGRRVMRVDLPDSSAVSIRLLADALTDDAITS